MADNFPNGADQIGHAPFSYPHSPVVEIILSDSEAAIRRRAGMSARFSKKIEAM